MGLDTTHNAWHGSYSSFNSFRERIAKHLGIPLLFMEGFYEEGSIIGDPLSMIKIACQNNQFGAAGQLNKIRQVLPIKWESLKPMAIHSLLHHSDCDGSLSPEECLGIAEDIKTIISEVENNNLDDSYFINKLQKFESGCRLAHSMGESIEFH